MTATSLFRVISPPSTRARVLDAAQELTVVQGWANVTMAKLAQAAGVSRQTVYNEVGGKPQLAEAMILAELDRFLVVVTDAFDENPDSLIHALRAAAHGVLVYAQGNRLIHAIVSATHGADTELLPLLTTHSGGLLTVAKAVVAERVVDYEIRLSPERLEAAIDMVVRLVLSHVMQPSGTPDATADDIAWIASQVLA